MSVYDTGLYRAVEAAGGIANMARAIGVTRQAVYPWLVRGWAPLKRAAQLSEMYGIPMGELVSPKLRKIVAETSNAGVRTGAAYYSPRKPSEDASDLV